jgi:multiple sugar transport system permease protein
MAGTMQLAETKKIPYKSTARVRARQAFGKVIKGIILVILFLIILTPVLWTGFMSLRTPKALFEMPPDLSTGWTFKNYIGLSETSFGRSLLNSLIVSSCTTLIALIVGTPAAYAISRHRFRREQLLGFWILAARLALPIGFALPLFIIFSRTGIKNSYPSVIIAYLIFTIPLVIWVMRPFIDTIPVALEEAAVVDGASNTQVFLNVVLPLSTTGLVAVGVLTFVMSWIEFFYALIFTRGDMITAPVEIVNFMHYEGWDWGSIASASILVLVPVVLFSIFTHKYLVSGLTGGAMKG